MRVFPQGPRFFYGKTAPREDLVFDGAERNLPMTAEEANRCYRIPPKVLRAYERWGFCRQKDGAAQYGEEDLAALSLLVTLCGAGFYLADAGEYLRLERAGAGAVVLKSLFEEDIVRRTESLTDEAAHTESADYLQGYLRGQMLGDYLKLVRESKSLCKIPVIASICCRSAGEWTDFARMIEQEGADALELNVMSLASDKAAADGAFEQRHVEILAAVKRSVSIPVIMKLGANLSNPVSLIERLRGYGAAAVVLFNRPYQTDIDIEKMEYVSGKVLSDESDLSNSLRWTGIASAAVKNISYAISGGVHSGEAVVKALLAGASAVEVCSAIYMAGDAWISSALETVEKWQERHGFDSVAGYRGRMNAADAAHVDRLERMQFLKYFEGFGNAHHHR